MNLSFPRTRVLLPAVALLCSAAAAEAQSLRMPSTARYGSGYVDVPSASVLPHLAITGTYGGYFLDIDNPPTVGPNGAITGTGSAFDRAFRGDASFALGLFDRAEIGTSLQQFGDAGDVYGFFGRLALFRPEDQGVGVAVGARYLTTSEDGVEPGRIGLFDADLRDAYAQPGAEGVDTRFSPYVVATGMFRGPEAPFLPKQDWSFSAGWGDGAFREGDQLEWYADSYSNGWFVGVGTHIEAGEAGRVLHLTGDYNGFDINVGAQLDWGGVRVGAYVLGVNYGEQISEYRSQKFGILGSLALCPTRGRLLCLPGLMDRPEPEVREVRVVTPPDTVIIEREVTPPLPTGTAATLCLATGEDVQVLVTAAGDTLVGPRRVPVRELQPGVDFAGSYAEGRDWYVGDQAIAFERGSFSRSGGEIRLDCGSIVRVGEFNGVSLFADRSAERPLSKLYVPVRPGVWQAYESGLRRTRGEE